MFGRRSQTVAVASTVDGQNGPAESDLAMRVHVSRQPVLDRYDRVAGYRIAYAAPDPEGPRLVARDGHAMAGDEAMTLFDTVLSVLGLERIVGDLPAHMPISERMLRALATPPIRPDRLQLRIAYADAVNPELQGVFEQIAERGYTMELDSVPSPDFDLGLLDRFGVVELDAAAWDPEATREVVAHITERHRLALAVDVPDYAARDAADALGFHRFTGAFFGTPKVIKGKNIPTRDIAALAALLQLQGQDVSLEEVVDVINHDVGLSVKLLRYINSAYFGLAAKVNSIRGAAVRLGSHGVARWALTITVTSTPGLSPEVATLALTRARLCEILAADDDLDSGELFTVGLLSAIDGVFNRPLETIVPELPLTRPVADALLHKTGPMGGILRMALAYERGDFGTSLLDKFGLRHARSYRDALSWAQETMVQTA